MTTKVEIGGVSPFFILAAEFASRGVEFWKPVHTNSDKLRGFEVQDPDGYVLYFGRPLLD
jgi:hypothetical protein